MVGRRGSGIAQTSRFDGVYRLGLLLFLLGCSGGDPTATDPALIFEDGFENPQQEVEILAQGGTMVRGVDAWLKLAPRVTELRLRRQDEYVHEECGEMLDWFRHVTDDRDLQHPHGGFNCRVLKDSRFSFDNGRWLLTDRSRGVSYYRLWKKNP
jgi:hypothetical protein